MDHRGERSGLCCGATSAILTEPVIQASLQQGQIAGRWPNPLELSDDGERVVANAFDDTPLLGGWGGGRSSSATLRLQNLIMQAKNWGELKPRRPLPDAAWGCTVVRAGGEAVYSWVDQGLCDVPDIEQLIDGLSSYED